MLSRVRSRSMSARTWSSGMRVGDKPVNGELSNVLDSHGRIPKNTRML